MIHSAQFEADIKKTRAEEFDLSIADSLVDFPLIARHNTMRGLKDRAASGNCVYFGTGIVTPHAISQDLPFDFLGMLLSAEWVRRKTGAKKIIHEISDSHALISYAPSDVAGIAQRQRETVTKFAGSLGLDDVYSCVLASEYREQKEFQDIQKEINGLLPEDMSPYIKYQSAGNVYFSRYKQVAYKVGWLVEDKQKESKLDERFFNEIYDDLDIDPMSFVYTWCGWNFDNKRARVSPYTFTKGENRLTLDGSDSALRTLRRHIDECNNIKIVHLGLVNLLRLVHSYELLFCPSEIMQSGDLMSYHDEAKLVLENPARLEALARKIDNIRHYINARDPLFILSSTTQFLANMSAVPAGKGSRTA